MSSGKILYFTNPGSASKSPELRKALLSHEFGWIDTPKQANIRPAGVVWCADNGCFGKGYPGDEKWLMWLDKHSRSAPDCWFATAPDVVGDARATLERSLPHLPRIREMGYPAALVSQDGLHELSVPWGEFDVMFIGGSDAWKLGYEAARLAAESISRGKPVHMGRVNSYKRLSYARSIGCRSADGTFITYAPTENLARARNWYRKIELENLR